MSVSWDHFFRTLPVSPMPRKHHPPMIAARTCTKAWYDLLWTDPRFRADLGLLFDNFTERDAERFLQKWAIGIQGYKDLRFSYGLREAGWNSSSRLLVGSRFCCASEAHVRTVPLVNRSPRLQSLGALRVYRKRSLRWSWRRIVEAEARETNRPIRSERDRKNREDAARHQEARWRAELGLGVRLGRPITDPKRHES